MTAIKINCLEIRLYPIFSDCLLLLTVTVTSRPVSGWMLPFYYYIPLIPPPNKQQWIGIRRWSTSRLISKRGIQITGKKFIKIQNSPFQSLSLGCRSHITIASLLNSLTEISTVRHMMVTFAIINVHFTENESESVCFLQ